MGMKGGREGSSGLHWIHGRVDVPEQVASWTPQKSEPPSAHSVPVQRVSEEDVCDDADSEEEARIYTYLQLFVH